MTNSETIFFIVGVKIYSEQSQVRLTAKVFNISDRWCRDHRLANCLDFSFNCSKFLTRVDFLQSRLALNVNFVELEFEGV